MVTAFSQPKKKSGNFHDVVDVAFVPSGRGVLVHPFFTPGAFGAPPLLALDYQFCTCTIIEAGQNGADHFACFRRGLSPPPPGPFLFTGTKEKEKKKKKKKKKRLRFPRSEATI